MYVVKSSVSLTLCGSVSVGVDCRGVCSCGHVEQLLLVVAVGVVPIDRQVRVVSVNGHHLVYVHICTYIQMRSDNSFEMLCMYLRMHIHIHTRTYIHTYAYMYMIVYEYTVCMCEVEPFALRRRSTCLQYLLASAESNRKNGSEISKATPTYILCIHTVHCK